ncbi:DUF4244 domain-containing protein [Candidatus Protofrankia californiensis]|uniref:DUF4244 domain-containing protein n=1 Tax=Candidatus Protofrankia californiensis TaxID=1839754 RepID=UPI001F49CDD2|nr:DUF4244 domain-containing protein [Candidatus Protofrankia californiensis]
MAALRSSKTSLIIQWKVLLIGTFMQSTIGASRRQRAGVRAVSATTLPRRRDDAGMSTAEYAVGTVAAVGFAAVLYAVINSSATRALLANLVKQALSIPF